MNNTKNISNDNEYKHTVNEVKYKGLGEIAKKNNLDYDLLRGRLELGYTLEEAIEKGESVYTVTAFGKEFKSIIELAECYEVDYERLYTKLRGKTPLEEAVTELLNEKTIKFNGKTYKSLRELCSEYKVHDQILTKRLNSGWTLEKALTTPIRKRETDKKYVYKGKAYISKRQLAEAYGFHLSYIVTTQKRIGLEFIECLDMMVRFAEQYEGERPEIITRLPFVIYNGEWIKTQKSFCEMLGITTLKLKSFMSHHKIKSHFEALEMMKAKDYPNLTFEITGYCAMPDSDFNKYLKENFG